MIEHHVVEHREIGSRPVAAPPTGAADATVTRCGVCGYELAATPATRCPECGTATSYGVELAARPVLEPRWSKRYRIGALLLATWVPAWLLTIALEFAWNAWGRASLEVTTSVARIVLMLGTPLLIAVGAWLLAAPIRGTWSRDPLCIATRAAVLLELVWRLGDYVEVFARWFSNLAALWPLSRWIHFTTDDVLLLLVFAVSVRARRVALAPRFHLGPWLAGGVLMMLILLAHTLGVVAFAELLRAVGRLLLARGADPAARTIDIWWMQPPLSVLATIVVPLLITTSAFWTAEILSRKTRRLRESCRAEMPEV